MAQGSHTCNTNAYKLTPSTQVEKLVGNLSEFKDEHVPIK